MTSASIGAGTIASVYSKLGAPVANTGLRSYIMYLTKCTVYDLYSIIPSILWETCIFKSAAMFKNH